MRIFGLIIGVLLCVVFVVAYDALHVFHEPWIHAWPLVGLFLSVLLVTKSLAPDGRLLLRLPVAAAAVGFFFLGHAWQVSQIFPALVGERVAVEPLTVRYEQCASLVLAPVIRSRVAHPATIDPAGEVLWQYSATVVDDVCRAFTIRSWRRQDLAYPACPAGQTLQSPQCYAKFIEDVNAAAPFTAAGQIVLLALSRSWRSAVAPSSPDIANPTAGFQTAVLAAHLRLARSFYSYRSMPAFGDMPGSASIPSLEEFEGYFKSSEYVELFKDVQAFAPEIGKSLEKLQQMRGLYADLEAEARKNGGTLDDPGSLDAATQAKYEKRVKEIMGGQ
jgi:hypothetical protein